MNVRVGLLALMLVAGPALADEIVPTPTENDGTQAAPDPAPEPTGCHRCVSNPDGGWSDSDYSNPTGAWTDTAGDTNYDLGHSQDWYEGTGPWTPGGCVVGNCTPSNARRAAGGGDAGNKPVSHNGMKNEPGHGTDNKTH